MEMQWWPGGCRNWLGGCRDVQADAGQPVPVEELKHSPEQTLCGVSVRDSCCEGRAGSQEYLPSASSLCLLHVAMAGWRGQWPQEVEWDTSASKPPTVPCQIAHINYFMRVSFDFTLWY